MQCKKLFLEVLVGTSFEEYKDDMWIIRGTSSLLKKLFHSQLVPPVVRISRTIEMNNQSPKLSCVLLLISNGI